ncbi:LytR C-terminal domain-containing protein [Nocardioides jensenii]|uniref:LytR C-terminal domain-containing protein n=1 Tax=Nocardioides jensenii TaxID=1843 RepID=UPI00082D4F03|nr:LytR C-terminal domain-containing protein [Nocardioides jensenii]
MDSRQTSTVTMAVLAVICVFMALFGISQVTRGLPTDSIVADEKPACETKTLKAGTKVRASDVTVSVFNASERNGLASKTMEKLITRGFGAGDSANAPSAKVRRVEVRAATSDDPAAKLVAAQFGKGTPVVTDQEQLGIGIVVVVGSNFTALSKGATKAVPVTEDSTVCSPPPD